MIALLFLALVASVAGQTCSSATCTLPSFCHGTPNSVCETSTYTWTANTQCATFRPHNTALTTLAAAQNACNMDPLCGGVHDLYCNGMFSATDHYALCEGTATVPDTTTFTCHCMHAAPGQRPPSGKPARSRRHLAACLLLTRDRSALRGCALRASGTKPTTFTPIALINNGTSSSGTERVARGRRASSSATSRRRRSDR